MRRGVGTSSLDWRLSPAPSAACSIPGGALLLRLRVAAGRHRLDRLLAAGADPAGSQGLALRARQLTSRRERDRLARSIRDLFRAGDSRPRWSSAVPPCRSAIDVAGPELRRIAEILSGCAPVYARGVALSDALVHDGQSPLYGTRETASARDCARRTVAALAGRL